MSEKSYAPTERRLQKACEEGKSKKSQLFNIVSTILVGLLSSYFAFRWTWVENQMLLEYLFRDGNLNPAEATSLCAYIFAKFVAYALGPVMLYSCGSQFFQEGLRFNHAVFSLKLSRLAPSSGLMRLISAPRELPWIFIRFAGVLLVCVLTFPSVMRALIATVGSMNHHAVSASQLLDTGGPLWVCTALCGVALIDFIRARRRWREDVFMNAHEMKDDQRENEGDPHTRGRRHALHQSLSREALVRRVREAKFVVVERM